jgi:NDP-sugar pyrophosphorylase family protein
MRAIILAGGQGTRLRPYTTVLPKPLMPVGDRPVMDIIVRQLRRAGFERVTVATGHLAELIETFFGDGSGYGVTIDYFRETTPLGTVGALAQIEDLDEDFLVMNGDVLTDLDYAGLMRAHARTEAIATIAATTRTVEVTLGVLHCGDEGDPTRLTDYLEKPRIDYSASMGVYAFSPAVLAHITPGEHLDFPDLILRLIDREQPVRALPSGDYWLDIGRAEDYELAQDHFAELRARLLGDES